MRHELEQKILDAAPLLYRDRYKGMQQTCMYWGISCGDGWFDIIYNLSLELEKEIIEWISKNPAICTCGCAPWLHEKKEGCTTIHYMPHMVRTSWCGVVPMKFKKHFEYHKHISKWKALRIWLKGNYAYTKKRVRSRWGKIINPVLEWLFEKGLYVDIVPCSCNGFEHSHPSAAQVKEKFGGLRFYMSGGTDRIYELINEAEELSYKTCEECGGPGSTEGSKGWISCLCTECRQTRVEKRKKEHQIDSIQGAMANRLARKHGLKLSRRDMRWHVPREFRME